MRIRAVVAALAAQMVAANYAFAWGPEGHQVVGSIADKMLKPGAKAQAADILGFTLRIAGPWADCVKSVKKQPDGTYKYIEEPQFSAPCKLFQAPEFPGEQARMED